MQGLQAHDWGAGQVLKEYAARLYDASFGEAALDALDRRSRCGSTRRSRPTGSTTTAT